MYPSVCPVCKSTIYGINNKYVDKDFVFHSSCDGDKKLKDVEKERPIRTSTPIAHFGNNGAPSFSDSVNEFFYQSWKSGLHSDDTTRSQSNGCLLPTTNVQPFTYPTQVVYVNTVIYQPVFPSVHVYSPQVGYRPDGTFGLLPTHWPYSAR